LLNAVLNEKRTVFEAFLEKYLKENNDSSGLFEACAYSLTAGGKRIRPVLAMLACEFLNEPLEKSLHAGLAIEMIHTFSLIHDDLPAIDNDDLRRGMLTCHKKFGEATAILAGDCLILLAFSVIGSSSYSTEIKNDITREIARSCGMQGLVQGEFLDVEAEGKEVDLEEIKRIHYLKTARLFELSMYAGARVARGGRERVAALKKYGMNLGLAFQAIDDILDVTSDGASLGKASQKDEKKGKATIVKVLGLDGARLWAEDLTNKAIQVVSGISGNREIKDILINLADEMKKRVK
jgi:geranylgeranyl diphosphate synthase type II